jgi:arginyl-tRNA synthetase
MNLQATLNERLVAAMTRAGCGDEPDPILAPASKPQFGHYQANGIMASAKRAKTNPRQLAEAVVAELDLGDIAETVEIAGPGFLNITLRDDWLETQLAALAGDDRLGTAQPAQPQTVVVDYSGPNLAKEMHVGHLRSTIIGDALARILDFTGQTVIRQNHVGDWGTQFGMLTEYLIDAKIVRLGGSATTTGTGWSLGDIEEVYRESKKRFDNDPEFQERSRQRVVKLQASDDDTLTVWKWFVEESLSHCAEVYRELGVLLTKNDVRGESAYNDDLPEVIGDLDLAGLLAESQGARGVFLEEFTNKDNEPAFVIVQKSDGGYLYATTDLAAIRYRVKKLNADRALYVTDSRQAEHFEKVFVIARKAGFAIEAVSLEHVPFGMMLGADGKPFKTRQGGTVKLMDLLDEATRRARQLVAAKAAQRGEPLDEAGLDETARVVGIGALKYADLSQNRTSDYVFSWDKMLNLEGNTAPYMQYAYARIRSIFRKGGQEAAGAKICLNEPAERALAVKLLQLPETLDVVARSAMPNVLCGYLYELAGLFMGFYENCPVLKADDAVRASRLALCELTARTIRTGLELLGIDTLDQM